MGTLFSAARLRDVFLDTTVDFHAYGSPRRALQLRLFQLGPCGFADHELNRIERLVIQHRDTLLEAWHEYFGA